jgi:hypothetical protein
MRRFSFAMASTAAVASGVTTRCAWPGGGESVTELMPFMNFLVHSYTCRVTDMYHHTELSFVDELQWISSLHYLKNGWHNSVLLWCTLQAGPPNLHYYCAVVLHSCIVLPPVGHPSNHDYHSCQLTRRSSCGSNFYRTFEVFIWLSLVCIALNRLLQFYVWAAANNWRAVEVICREGLIP